VFGTDDIRPVHQQITHPGIAGQCGIMSSWQLVTSIGMQPVTPCLSLIIQLVLSLHHLCIAGTPQGQRLTTQQEFG
jgi:putative alpha-1,2-mannosidase